MKLQEGTLKPTGSLRNLDVEWRKCKLSPHYFLKTYGKIKDEQAGIIPFQDWDYLVDLLNVFSKERRIIILKARQLGITTLISGYILHRAIFFEGSTIYVLSQNEKAAFKVIEKCKIMWEYLPDFLRIKLGKDQLGALSFPTTHSSIDALPSTEDAGRMTGATIVVSDEWERHPYAEQNYLAVMPTLGAGGQFIGLSTPDLLAGDTFFKKMYHQTKSGETRFKPVFLSWDLRPDRDQVWYDGEKRDYVGVGFEQEYPSTEDEALSLLKVAKFFDPDVLIRMYSDCKEPIEIKYSGAVKIYKEPDPGKRYYGAIDPSDGQYDPGAGVIFDWKTDEEVAEFHGKLRVEEQAVIWYELCQMYNNCFQAPEANAKAGGAIIQKLQEIETSEQKPLKWFYSKKNNRGWWTGNNRSTMLLQYADAIFHMEYIFHNKEIIDEHKTFIRPEGKDPQPARGAHDDYVMAVAIANQIKKSMPVGSVKVTSGKYRT